MLTDHEYDVLYIACEMERRGITVYRRAQTLVTDEKVLSLLKRLESDEMKHLTYFSGLLVGAPDEDLGAKRVVLSAYAQKALFQGGVMELAREAAFASWDKLLDHAINDEAKAIKTYEAFSHDARDAAVKDMFLMIRDEEKTHLNDLTVLRAQMLESD